MQNEFIRIMQLNLVFFTVRYILNWLELQADFLKMIEYLKYLIPTLINRRVWD